MAAAKRVAVVGAGPSGLATVKELLDEGHHPVCFERAASLGGVFRFDEDTGVVWESCRLTSSGLLTAFSDFPITPDRAEHMKTGEYVDYLKEYCAAFGVDRCLRFDATVEAITRDPSGGWRVATRGRDGEPSEERFDAVAVCSGLHQNPHRPRFEGQATFPGEIMHGAEYRRPAQVAGKRVLVIGAGESGADIVAEVAEHAAETVLSLRRGIGVVPRKRYGYPNDFFNCRLNNSSAHWIYQTRHPSDAWKLKLYLAVFFPFVLADKCVQQIAALGQKLRLLAPLMRLRRLGASAFAQARINNATERLTKELLNESGGTLQENFGTKSDEFVRAMAAGRCRRVASIARFEGRRVCFDDGSVYEPDLVILCTGFDVQVPFLDESLTRPRRFLEAFVPEIGASLAFIGFLRPAFGAIPPLAELQARWFALLTSGKAALPPEAEMHAAIDRLRGFRRHYFRAVRERLDYLVDFYSLCDDLAEKIGCKPTREAIRRESLRFRVRFFAGPYVAAQYRLIGPHAKPALARQVIAGLPIAQPRHALALFYLRWTLSRVLYRLLGPEFATKLALD
jgi:dimethylaniline monooxygenase (N-oxide forming)